MISMQQMLSCTALFLCLGAPALDAASVSENHPDGSKALKVSVNKDGERDGALTAWWPGGKVVQEKSKWNDGKLHGVRQTFDEQGTLRTEEAWLDGRLIYPRSQTIINARFTQLKADSQRQLAELHKSPDFTAELTGDQADALTQLRQYRFLCGLTDDIDITNTYTLEAQKGAEILVAIGKLDHFPKQPAQWSDADYALAQSACGHGNLAMGGGNLTRAVDMWMDDSDPSNIGALGHRRWMLNPSMGQCGFGIDGNYQVIWAHDQSQQQPTAQSWQAFPPPGFVPTTHFGNRHAWHISLNPKDYSIDLKAMTFAIYPLDQRLQRNGAAYILDHDGSDGTGYGSYKNARIVRPATDRQPTGQPPYTVAKNRSFEAVVTGLKPRNDAPNELSWIVTFY